MDSANTTQSASQATLQQVGSIPHTPLQQSASEHDGLVCALKHDWPPVPQVLQNLCANDTHTSSHATSQQVGSTRHTVEQQSELLHPGAIKFAVKQSLAAVEQFACAWTSRTQCNARRSAQTVTHVADLS
jgi:hypothetical protein